MADSAACASLQAPEQLCDAAAAGAAAAARRLGGRRVGVEEDARMADALRLSAVQDDDDQPFKSKYAARDIWKEMKSELEARASQSSPSSQLDCSLGLALLNFYLGCNLIDTEEVSSGEKLLLQCESILKDHFVQFHLELIELNNKLGILWSSRSEYDKSKEFLACAEKMYYQAQPLYHISDCGEYPEDPCENLKKLESSHTHTLFYLAQVYGQLQQTHLAARYCYRTLNRQLHSHQHNSMEWAANCVKLSAFYISHHRLRQALHCVQAALKVAQVSDSEEYRMLKGDAACATGEIFATQLRESRNHQLHRESAAERKEAFSDSFSFDQTLEMFPDCGLDEPSTFALITTRDEAYAVFRKGSEALQSAMGIYVLDGFVSDHVVLKQKLSGMLRDLCTFESNLSTICKLQKRRISVLEPLLSELNPRVYGDFFRQISHEVAESYADMAEKKIIAISDCSNGADSINRTKKANQLALKAISHFRMFCKAVEGDDPERTPIPKEFHRAYLNSRFQIARMFGKMLPFDSAMQASLLQHGLEQYEAIVNFVSKHKVENFENENLICQEMCTLLPLQIQRLRRAE